jgi:TPR repeat protein
MLKFIQYLINLNGALARKIRATQAYDEGLALHGAEEYAKAFPVIKEAAELGHDAAMTVYGSMLLLGQGVKEDGEQAELWLKRAADAGYEDAISVLGMAYATGKAGCRRDVELGRKLLTRSAEAGDEQSRRMLEMMDKGEGIFHHHKRDNRRR